MVLLEMKCDMQAIGYPRKHFFRLGCRLVYLRAPFSPVAIGAYLPCGRWAAGA